MYLSGRPERSKGGFWSPRGFPKSAKIDMMRIDRHLGEAKWAKKLPENGFEMIQKMLPTLYPTIDVFRMPKPTKSTVKVSKIKVLGAQQKHQHSRFWRFWLSIQFVCKESSTTIKMLIKCSPKQRHFESFFLISRGFFAHLMFSHHLHFYEKPSFLQMVLCESLNVD